MRIVASDCADGNLIITTALPKSTVKRNCNRPQIFSIDSKLLLALGGKVLLQYTHAQTKRHRVSGSAVTTKRAH